jgi:hypothetical protein
MRDDAFFKDTPRKTLEMKGESVEFPVLYYDFRSTTCIFTARIKRLKSILPHPQFIPIQLWPGTGLFAITAFEYRDTSIGPYNEVALSVPLNFPPAAFLGRHSALSMMRKNIFPVYIHHLPVTTEIARDGGIHFYNYPKFLAEIDFQDRQDFIEITLKEGDYLILKLLAKKLPLKKSALFEFHTFSLGEKTIMHALAEGRAAKFGQKMLGKCGELELGSHRISDELKALELSKSAWSGFCGEGAMSKLYDPDQQWDKDTLKPVLHSNVLKSI